MSADRRGVMAMMHVATKKTRMRLIAFEPANDFFIRRMPPVYLYEIWAVEGKPNNPLSKIRLIPIGLVKEAGGPTQSDSLILLIHLHLHSRIGLQEQSSRNKRVHVQVQRGKTQPYHGAQCSHDDVAAQRFGLHYRRQSRI